MACSDWMISATRTFNLDPVRAGLLWLARERFHMLKLVDAIFSEGDFQEKPEAPSPERHEP